MNTALRRTAAIILAAFLFLAAFIFVGAPSAAHADAGPIVVETSPPDPTLDAECAAVDPDPTDVWSYISTPDPVGGTTQVDAFVPEGYVIGDTGMQYWLSVEGVWDMTCPVADAPAPVEPAPVAPAEPDPQPITPVGPVTELALTGPDEHVWVVAVAGLAVVAAGVFMARSKRLRRE